MSYCIYATKENHYDFFFQKKYVQKQSLYYTPKSIYLYKSCERRILKIIYMTNTQWENIYVASGSTHL